MCIASALFWMLFYCHRLILYNINEGSCSPQPGLYDDFDGIIEVIFKGVCPPLVMVTLAFLLVRSVRSAVRRRVVPNDKRIADISSRQSSLEKMDSRLTMMLMLQSIIASITYLPLATNLIYWQCTQHLPRSKLQSAEDRVYAEVSHLLSYVFFASSFYVSMISNAGFRRRIKHFFSKSQHSNDTTLVHTAGGGTLTVAKQPNKQSS